MTKQTKTNNLNYLFDLTFTKFNNTKFVLSSKNEDRISYSKYNTANVEIKDFSELIDVKIIFDTLIKNRRNMKQLLKWAGIINDYTTGSLSDYEHFLKHWKLIAIDLCKYIELENPDSKQPINFILLKDVMKIKLQCYLSLISQKKQLLIFRKLL